MISKRHIIKRGGQGALSVTLLIGGIVVLMGGTIAFLVVAFLHSSSSFQAANRALAVASGGARDALIQLARNKDFEAIGANVYCVPANTVPCPQGFAEVTVTQNAPALGQATIISEGTSGTHKRKIRAVVSIATSTGESTLVSWEIVTL